MTPETRSEPTRSASTRRRFIGAAAAAVAAGLAGCSSDGSGDGAGSGSGDGSGSGSGSGDGAETVAAVTLDGASNGLRKYRCTVEQEGDVPIAAVDPGLIDGDEFQVRNGGVDSSSVEVRAADVSESVGAFDGTRTLFTVTFEGAVDAAALSLSVGVATDDDGESIPPDRLSVGIE